MKIDDLYKLKLLNELTILISSDNKDRTLRVGQLLSNILEEYKQDNKCDLFYIKDKDLEKWINQKRKELIDKYN